MARYLAAVHGGGHAPGDRFFGPIERALYRVAGVDPRGQQRWQAYARSVLAFSAVSMGGELAIEDTPGGGATMIVILPQHGRQEP